MGQFSFLSKNTKPRIVAEISANHNGSLDRALDSITAAKKCGADAVKIQTYTAETMTINCRLPDFTIKNGLWKGFSLYELYKWAHTPFEWHKTLFEHAKKERIPLFSTPFDETAVDLLENLKNPIYKIASFELVDLPLIKYVAKTRKPMILSTGMATEKEIKKALTTAQDNGCKQILLLHCISNYPNPIDQANLRHISVLAKRFQVPVGLSDHTLGYTASIVATALGARIIEKHFTLSRADKSPDSEFSLEPQELKEMCQKVHEAYVSMGNPRLARTKAESKNKIFRRSLYFVKNLKPGHILRTEDIRRIRPGLGLPIDKIDKILGKRLKNNVWYGKRVLISDVFLKFKKNKKKYVPKNK
jgi:N-acetylneuraminate synthase